MATKIQRAADMKYALIAKRYGMKNSLRTAWEARDAGIKASLGYALVEQETGNGANVWGHDPTIFIGGYDAAHHKHWGPYLTEAAYRAYKHQRGTTRMQGVGPLQLTWYSTQDAADHLGGCWAVKYNLRIGFHALHSLIQAHGLVAGIARYNGSGPQAAAYSVSVRAKEKKWHRRLYVR